MTCHRVTFMGESYRSTHCSQRVSGQHPQTAALDAWSDSAAGATGAKIRNFISPML